MLQVLFLQPGAVFQKGGIDMMPGMDGFLQGGRGEGREGREVFKDVMGRALQRAMRWNVGSS